MNRCGTHLGYRDHQAIGEPTCRPCRDAQAAWQRNYIKRRYLAGARYVERSAPLAGGRLLIDGTGTRRRLQALAVMGWPSIVLSELLGSARSYASALAHKERVQRGTADKVAALYDELSMVRGPSVRASQDARRKGWVPPLSWNDEDIDDPAAKPAHHLRGTTPGYPRDPDREAKVLELTRAGLSAAEIAMRLRTNKRYVVRVRSRYRDEEAS